MIECVYRNETNKMVILKCVGELHFYLEKVVMPKEWFLFEAPKEARLEFWKMSPQGKMPMLQTDSGLCIAESSAIFSYLTDRFSDSDPSFTPQTAEERAISNMITCIHDNYLSGIQGCLYKAMSVEERSMKLKELSKQIDVIEHHMSAGPFVAGKEISQG